MVVSIAEEIPPGSRLDTKEAPGIDGLSATPKTDAPKRPCVAASRNGHGAR